MDAVFFLRANVDCIFAKKGGEFQGKPYPPSYVYQVSAMIQKNNEPRIMRIDLKAPEEFGRHENLIGKTVLFPVEVNSGDRGLSVKVAEGVTVADCKVQKADTVTAS